MSDPTVLLRHTLRRFAILNTSSPDRKECRLCLSWLNGYDIHTAAGHKDDCLLHERFIADPSKEVKTT